MYIANNWTEYKLIDASDGMRLESWSGQILYLKIYNENGVQTALASPTTW